MGAWIFDVRSAAVFLRDHRRRTSPNKATGWETTVIGKLELFDIDPDAWPVIDAGLQYLIDSIVPPQAAVVPAAAGVAADVESELSEADVESELSEVERTVSEVERTAHGAYLSRNSERHAPHAAGRTREMARGVQQTRGRFGQAADDE